jgi:hypothetical protein
MPKVINTSIVQQAIKQIETVVDKESHRKFFSTRQVIDETQLFVGCPINICCRRKEKIEVIPGIVDQRVTHLKNGRKFFLFKKAPSGKDKRIFLDEYSIVKYLDGTWNEDPRWIEIN